MPYVLIRSGSIPKEAASLQTCTSSDAGEAVAIAARLTFSATVPAALYKPCSTQYPETSSNTLQKYVGFWASGRLFARKRRRALSNDGPELDIFNFVKPTVAVGFPETENAQQKDTHTKQASNVKTEKPRKTRPRGTGHKNGRSCT